MNIHTLGPEATDSYAAASVYNQRYCQGQATIMGHASFEDLLTTLARYPGDLVVIPAAFKSPTLHASWGDVHYALLDQWTLVTSFITALDPLVVIERRHADNRIGYTHAATAQLLARIVSSVDVQTAASKFLAYRAYCANRGAYVLTNEKNVTLRPDERQLKRLTPKMVWCVYQIK